MRVERTNGKLGVRVGDDGYDGIELLTTRNGYQWSGGTCNRELLLMVRDAITEFLGPAQETAVAHPITATGPYRRKCHKCEREHDSNLPPGLGVSFCSHVCAE